jgi:hypothetical protein
MKNQVLSALFALFSLSVFAQIPTYVPANGLVGWWPFNGNANDESGNGNNVVFQGNASYTTDRYLVPNKSYFGDLNSGADITQLNNFPFGNSERTISLWFQNTMPYPNGIRSLFSYGDNYSGGRFGLFMDGFYIGVEHVNGDRRCTYIPDGSWHNLLVTYPLNGLGTNDIALYLDGHIQNSSNFNPVNSLNTANASIHYIGTLGFSPGWLYAFSGKIDDIGIWNRVLTQCEIQDLYDSQLGSQAISAGFDQSICAGDNVTLNGSGGSAYQWNNNIVDGALFAPTQTATYTVNGTDSLGCSGSDTVMVTVLENAAGTQNQTAFDSYTLNGQTYTQSGTYTQTVPSANGCDSVITLNLTLNFTGISENTTAQISISPNPASSKIIVKSDVALIGSKFIIYDALGKEIKSGKLTTIETEVDLSNLYNGVYLFKVGAKQLGTFKIIKE